MHGVFGFVDLLFCEKDIRKIYGAVPSYNFDQFAHLVPLGCDAAEPSQGGELIDIANLFEIEAVLTNHKYFQGERWDLLVGSVSSNVWARYRAQFLEVLKRDMDQMSL